MSARDPLIAHPTAVQALTSADRAQRVTRRHMLGGAMAAAGLAAVSQGVRGVGSAPTRQATPTATVVGANLVEPPVLRSVDGRL
ncbi:MAG TPA: hypothetical protein VK356_12790, partial [Thermomicrobiales bacterium]|nr:hypothetical protein [Thermomicrobiales bacterium]